MVGFFVVIWNNFLKDLGFGLSRSLRCRSLATGIRKVELAIEPPYPLGRQSFAGVREFGYRLLRF